MADNKSWGLDDPHPFSLMKTELIWEGKYDEYGNRRTVDIAGCAMPFQKIETLTNQLHEPWSKGTCLTRIKPIGMISRSLIWGENKLVMASLLKELKGKKDLICTDPPFDVGADFTFEHAHEGKGGNHIQGSISLRDRVSLSGYVGGKGTDYYLNFIYVAGGVTLMKGIVGERSRKYFLFHCDWHVGHYLRSVLNEVFDEKNFRNEIIWF